MDSEQDSHTDPDTDLIVLQWLETLEDTPPSPFRADDPRMVPTTRSTSQQTPGALPIHDKPSSIASRGRKRKRPSGVSYDRSTKGGGTSDSVLNQAVEPGIPPIDLTTTAGGGSKHGSRASSVPRAQDKRGGRYILRKYAKPSTEFRRSTEEAADPDARELLNRLVQGSQQGREDSLDSKWEEIRDNARDCLYDNVLESRWWNGVTNRLLEHVAKEHGLEAISG